VILDGSAGACGGLLLPRRRQFCGKTEGELRLAYAELLEDVGAGRLTPEEAQTILAIVSKRACLSAQTTDEEPRRRP
jgi:hypothetical protein